VIPAIDRESRASDILRQTVTGSGEVAKDEPVLPGSLVPPSFLYVIAM
jgi:hypothetical protein